MEEEEIHVARIIMMRQVDVFTTKPFSGNPAGVVTEAEELTTEMMQAIAAETNLGETTFVTASTREDASFGVRFFTPTEEFDLSGHAIIASCFALIEEGKISLDDGVTQVLFDTRAGLARIDIHTRTIKTAESKEENAEKPIFVYLCGNRRGILEKIMLHQAVKRHRPSDISIKEIATYCGVDEEEIKRTGLPLETISTGLEQLMIPVLHKETIRDMNPDLIRLGIVSRKHGIQTNHFFSLEAFSEDCTAYMRNFAPAIGMWEDPASGTAAAGLTSYLLRHGVITSSELVIEQGKDTENLARIIVDGANAENPQTQMRIGGLAVTSITRRIEIEAESFTVS